MSELQTFLDATLVAGVLALLLLALRRPLIRLFGAQGSYLAWLVVAIPALPLRLPQWPSVDPGGLLATSAQAMRTVTVQMEAVASGPDLGAILAAVWFAGACALFAWGLGRYLYLQQVLRDAERVTEHLGYPVFIAAVPVPMVVGVISPRIVVPTGLWCAADAEAMAHILEHESVHAERRDVLWNLIGYSLLCLHWINPVAWLAYAAMRRDQELSCDARVTGASSRGDRAAYARTLVEVMASQPATAAPAMAADIRKMEERLMMVWKHRKRPLGRVAAVGALALGVSTLAFRAGAAETARTFYEEADSHAVRVVQELHAAGLAEEAEAHPENYILQGGDGVFYYGDGSPVPEEALAEMKRELEREREMLHREREAMDAEALALHEALESREDLSLTEREQLERERASLRELVLGLDGTFSIDVELDVGGRSFNPTIHIRDGSTGRIESRGGDSGRGVAMDFEAEQQDDGSVYLEWVYLEQHAGEWMEMSAGQDVIDLGRRTPLIIGVDDARASVLVDRLREERYADDD